MDQVRPELDNVLQSLSLNGYSIFSLINDILPRRNWEDERIKLLREGLERDSVDICARLLSNMTSGPERVIKFGRVQFKNHSQIVPLDILPDSVILDIFAFCLLDSATDLPSKRGNNWHTLVHVCRRWRRIIFASPRQLHLYLHCYNETPVLKNLDFWPATLPLTLNYTLSGNHIFPRDENNIAAALRHPSRVHRVSTFGGALLIKKVATIMRKSFPALTHLNLVYDDFVSDDDSSTFPVIPRSLLGGSAPCLQHLHLKKVSFPRLPMFLLSARNLVTLQLEDTLQKGYIFPEAMAGGLAVLTKLTTLSISSNEEIYGLNQQTRTDPSNRVILPALFEFHYKGCSDYLEGFLAQVDTPRLNHLRIEYIAPHIRDPQPYLQLSRFVDRTENLKLDKFTSAKVIFYHDDSYFEFGCLQRKSSQTHLSLKLCDQDYLSLQVSYMAQVLGQLPGQLAVFPDVDDLSICGIGLMGLEDMNITEWLPFFQLFPAVRALRLSGGVKTSIVSAFEETTQEAVTDHVFPALRSIWLVEDGDEVQDEGEAWGEDEDEEDRNIPAGAIGHFLSLRQLAGRPVTVVTTEDEFVEANQEANVEAQPAQDT